MGFPGGSVVKNPPTNSGASRDVGSIPGSRRSPEIGNGNPFHILARIIPWTGVWQGCKESDTTE